MAILVTQQSLAIGPTPINLRQDVNMSHIVLPFQLWDGKAPALATVFDDA